MTDPAFRREAERVRKELGADFCIIAVAHRGDVLHVVHSALPHRDQEAEEASAAILDTLTGENDG